MVEKRKGIGYVLEAIAAVMTLLLFAVGNSPAPPAQDWSTFQEEISANDLGYTLKQTGDLEDFVRDREGGSFQTVTEELSSGRLSVAGTLENIPKDDSNVGFHVLKRQHHETDVDAVSSCEGDLADEVENQSEIISTEKEPPRHETELYFAKTGNDVAEGYDTLYVDNETPCQFSSAEGPFYPGDFFKWGNSTNPDEYEFYQFKNITDTTFTFNNATQVVRLKKTVNRRLNGIETDQSFNTFRLSDEDIQNYDTIVFKQSDALDDIQNEFDSNDNIEKYAEDGSILLLMNLTESDFNSYSFLRATGLKWVDLDHEEAPSGLRLDNSQVGETVQKYLRGMDARASDVSLPTGGNVSSSNAPTIIGDKSIAYGQSGSYKVTQWNVTNFSMEQVDPDAYSSDAPESECYQNSKTGNFTLGEFTFDTGKTVKVLNIKLGDTHDYCSKNVRALKFLENPNLPGKEDLTEKPYLNGERLTVGNKSFVARTYTQSGNNNFDNGEAAEFIFTGEDDIETVNYRESFEGFRGERLARLAYKPRYSDGDRKMIGSVLYWLVGDRSNFGSLESSTTSTYLIGGIDQNTFMPYKYSLRWK